MVESPRGDAVRVILVEDDPSFLEELSASLVRSRRIEIAAAYRNAADAIAGIGRHAADVVLLDLGLPDRPGVEVIRYFAALPEAPEFLVLTVFDDDQHLFPALQAGAVGYIVKDRTASADVADAITEVVQGGAPMSMEIARRVLGNFREAPTRHPRCALLSVRERQVLEQLTQGYNAKKVAEMLGITYQTVRCHQKNIYKKLHVNSLLEAVNLFRTPG